MLKRAIIILIISLIPLFPVLSRALTEKQIDELINSIGIKFDETTEKLFRERYASWKYPEEVEQLAKDKSQNENIISLANTFGLSTIDEIKVEPVFRGQLWIRVIGSKSFFSSNQYTQKIIYVANNQIGNSILRNEKPPFTTIGNYYTNIENLFEETRCSVNGSGFKQDFKVLSTTCESVWPILERIRMGEISFHEGWKETDFREEILKTSVISIENNTIEINVKLCNESNYQIIIEQKDEEYRVKSVYYVTS